MVKRGQEAETSVNVSEFTELKREDENEKVAFNVQTPLLSGNFMFELCASWCYLLYFHALLTFFRKCVSFTLLLKWRESMKWLFKFS